MKFAFLAVLSVALALAGAAQAADDTIKDCRIGAYRLDDGRSVSIASAGDKTLRWRLVDGATGLLTPDAHGVLASTLGWTGKPDGHVISFGPCDEGGLRFDSHNGRRVPLDITETKFTRGDVTFAGRLVLPKGSGSVPIVVLLHGGETDSALEFQQFQWLLPAEGVGVFVYDKRGTGRSTGSFTADFGVLADDAVAAMAETRRLAGARAGRVGYWGGSQGGWVAPLAAFRTHADFVIVGFGLLVDALEEDREEIALEMSLKGHSPAEIAKAEEVGYAAQTMLASNFAKGVDDFDALRTKYKNEPWYKDLEGNLTRLVLPLSKTDLASAGKMLSIGLAWNYDGMEVARRLDTPQLWQLGADDLEAPSAETSRRLKALIADGRPITFAMFPHAEHGVLEYVINAKGERDDTRNPDGYVPMLIDFARDGAIHGPYGHATIVQPKTPN
jgi:pimeloyl-ACP methyl ester carboxylesterase